MLFALPPLQAPAPPAQVAGVPWWSEPMKLALPFGPMAPAVRPVRRAPQRAGEATVEVTALVLPEEVIAHRELKLSLTAAALETFRLSGSGSLEGRAMLATFSGFDASNIQGLANAQTKALQELFNPPRPPSTGSGWNLAVRGEPQR